MSYLFTRLNFEIPFSGAEYLNESDVKKVINQITPEEGFINWFFGGSSASLVSSDKAHSLSEANTTLTKIYGDNYVELPANSDSLLNGLRTEYSDSVSQTMCAVIKFTGEPSQILLGSMNPTSGECIQMTSSAAISYSYRPSSGGGNIATSIPVPPGLTKGDNIFIAITRNGDDVIAFVGGAASKLHLSAPKSIAQSAKVGIGNCNFTSTAGFSKTMQCYEFIFLNGPVTDGKLSEVYANARNRCSSRGINII